jgi:hypothetical protein
MASTRKSASDRSFMDKIYRPVAGYVGNVVKEGSEAAKAWSRSVDANDKAKNYPPAKRPALNAAASAAGKKAEAERGQFLGSLVGKRYDSKGKRR